MATARSTVGNMFGTVSNTALALTSVVDVLGDFINMGSERVKHMAKTQQADLILESQRLGTEALNRHAIEVTKNMEETAKFRNANGADSTRISLFDNSYNSGLAALQAAGLMPIPEDKPKK